MRQDDTSSALFNLALHGEIQNIQIQGAMMNGMTQLFACADDIAVMSYGTEVLKELLHALEREGM
jgi:hypothetical protein